ncbi:MAG: hypothetical protein JW807_02030 [Spirochaetes bacterium]|nr:hypothetical protein [Spirochaetota bacterium]
MKRYGVFLLVLLFTVSCSKYHVKKEIRNNKAISQLKNSGIIFRVTHNTPIPLSLFNKNLTQWLEPYKKLKTLKILDNISNNLNTAKGESERFAQFAPDKDFQFYQSVGIIKGYLDKNREELDKLKAEYGLDSFIVYEVDGAMSAELQFADFNSMICIVNNNYQIIYLDRQADKYDAFEIDKHILREDLLDQISNRFLELMFKFKFIKVE